MRSWSGLAGWVLSVTLGSAAFASDARGDASLKDLIYVMPKAELHVHFEGTMEPELYLQLAERNRLAIAYPAPAAVRQRLTYARDLNTFIEVFAELQTVLRTQQDFHDVAVDYFRRAKAQQVVYVEMFFDPQTHVERGVPLATMFAGLLSARTFAREQLGVRVEYIMCFNRDRTAESAAGILEDTRPWHRELLGIGLDNPEENGFPTKFAALYVRARTLGLRCTAHCDVNQPQSLAHLRGCLEILNVERIDHGINVLDDPALIAMVRDRRIGLTVCPTLMYSEIPGRMEFRAGAIKRMLELGLLVNVNSDDPGLMRGLLVGDLLWRVQQTAGLSRADIVTLAENGFKMAWLSEEDRKVYLKSVAAAAL